LRDHALAMNEYDTIRAIAARFPRSRDQLNRPFECDAELLRLGDQTWGLTMDEFSPGEDRFTDEAPAVLGANLAVATLSDLLAAGVAPRFFLHALSLPRDVPPAFVEALTEGIRGVLDRAGCALCGGDLGTADTWRYCGFAMGPVISAKPLTHRLPAEPQTLWVTGELGDANLAALRQGATPPFELRLKEAAIIRGLATACIDTSGGLMDAVWILHTMSPGVRIDLHADRVPLARGIREATAAADLPAEAALVGGAGEYELLFATPRDLDRAARTAFGDLGITPIADVALGGNSGVHINRNGIPVAVMAAPPPCPRAAPNEADYLQAVVQATEAWFGR
jgi:thiamine-monophosphate kinase